MATGLGEDGDSTASSIPESAASLLLASACSQLTPRSSTTCNAKSGSTTRDISKGNFISFDTIELIHGVGTGELDVISTEGSYVHASAREIENLLLIQREGTSLAPKNLLAWRKAARDTKDGGDTLWAGCFSSKTADFANLRSCLTRLYRALCCREPQKNGEPMKADAVRGSR